MGGLAGVPAPELGATAVRAALAQADLDPSVVQELIFGCVLQANLGQAPATQVLLKAGLPDTIPATLVNKVCASGMKATAFGAQAIQLGHADIVVAGGMENMSATPFYATQARAGGKYGHQTLVDGVIRDGLQDAYEPMMMGDAGEITAEKYNISREAQDEFAISSYQKAQQAIANGSFQDVIAPVTIETRKGALTIDTDEDPGKANFEKMKALRPAFKRDGGTITAANAPSMNDGGAALILASEKAVKEHGLKPLARIASFADAARKPVEFTVAPSDALPIALARAGKQLADMDAFEINEAFSVVALANQQILGLDGAKLNQHGGAVAIGHPLGASGARIISAMITVLHQNGGQWGGLGICNGGGGASAMVIEKA